MRQTSLLLAATTTLVLSVTTIASAAGSGHRGQAGRMDTDRDGLRDAAEVKTGHDPRRADTDGDGIRDGREGAGRVVKVKRGVVTLEVAKGRRVRARITAATELRCAAASDWLLGLPDDEAQETDDVSPTEDSPFDVPPSDTPPSETVDDTTETDEPVTDDPSAERRTAAEMIDEATDDSAGDRVAAAPVCGAALIRKGTWLHSSQRQGRGRFKRFSSIDIVVDPSAR